MIKTLILPLALAAGVTQASAFGQTGELTTNGDFETGDVSGWQYFASPASTFDAINDAAGGSFAGSLENTALASAALARQNNIGIGQVEPGDAIRVSFAARGMTDVGGVVFAEFFSEGSPTTQEFLGGGPLPLTSEYQNFCFTTTAGPSTIGGLTLQIAAITGGAMGSMAQVDIDNVSVEVNNLIPNGNFELGGTNFWTPGLPPTATFTGTMDANSGSFAANLNNTFEGAAAFAFQERLGEGEIQIGDTLDISFASKANFGPGGVMFVLLFTQDANGAPTSTNFLGGGPLFPGATYEDFNFQFTPTTDVSGGVKIEFQAVTGALSGSTAEIFFDDVRVERNVGSVLNICSANPNSAGGTASMGFNGSPSISADDFEITASGMIPNQFCLFITGTTDANVPTFDGRLCIDNFCRIGPILQSDGAGFASRAMPSSVYAQFGCQTPMVGDRVLYQCFYRDTAGAGGNLTDALCVVFGN